MSSIHLAGRHLSMLPVEPKLGKMLIFGAIFNCLDPILTVVAGLSVRDPFLTPFDKKDVSKSLKCLLFKVCFPAGFRFCPSLRTPTLLLPLFSSFFRFCFPFFDDYCWYFLGFDP